MDIRTFFVTQDREKSTDSVQGAAAQNSIDSVEEEESTVSVKRPTTHSVPLSSGRAPCRFYSEWYFFQQSSPIPTQPSTAVHTYDGRGQFMTAIVGKLLTALFHTQPLLKFLLYAALQHQS